MKEAIEEIAAVIAQFNQGLITVEECWNKISDIFLRHSMSEMCMHRDSDDTRWN